MSGSEAKLSKLVADLDIDAVVETVGRRLAGGEDPLHIVDECRVGVMQVGRLYEQEIYYISGLIMAGQIMHRVSQLVFPVLQGLISGSDAGRVLLGTVQGDIHYVGKNLFKVLLQCSGFSVFDAGEDVEPAEFVKHVERFSPHVIGLSCLLTTAYDSMLETVNHLKEAGRKSKYSPSVIIGGNVDADVCRYAGADDWARDAMDGVRICQNITRELTGWPK
jgi:methanogenic corrinoid protein MtbC1